MKKLFLLLTLVSAAALAQKPTCCTIPNITDKNAELAMNAGFAAAHAEPLAFTLESPKGEVVHFATDDGKQGSAYLVKAAKQPAKKAMFVFHEWWGLNDYIKRASEDLQAEMPGTDIYAIDLYDGNVATTRDDAQKYMNGMTDARARAIIRGAFTHVGKKVKVGTIGWCFGGGWSLQAALTGGKHVKACVMYYGMPEMDVNKLKALKCDVLGIFGEKDEYIHVGLVKAFEDKVKEAGKKIVVYNYVAEHGFANPSNPNFNKEAMEDAHKKVMVYLKKRLKIKA